MWKTVMENYDFPYVHFKAFRAPSQSSNTPPDCKLSSSHKT